MTSHEIIPPNAYEGLPSDPAEQFLALVAVAEANLSKRGGGSSSLRKRFMGEIAAAADELKVGKLPAIPNSLLGDPDWENFLAQLGGLKIRLRLRNENTVARDTVLLQTVTKIEIEREINSLRVLISNANIPESKKRVLCEKLDEFTAELHRKRVSFSKVAAVAAAIAGVFGGTSVGLANAPEAMETVGKILQLIGQAKAAEEEDQLLLAPPLVALSPPTEEDESSAEDSSDNG